MMRDSVPEVSVFGRQPEVKRVLGVGCTAGPPDLKSCGLVPIHSRSIHTRALTPEGFRFARVYASGTEAASFSSVLGV